MVAAAPRQMARNRARNHWLRNGLCTSAVAPCSSVAGSAASSRRRGLAIHSRIPAATPSISMTNSTHCVGHTVAAHTPTAGPTMKDSSTATPSSEMAVRRSCSDTEAMTAWRMIENDGMTNSPASAASASSHQYDTNGATDQQAAATMIEGTTTRRSPRWSSSRPRQGPLMAIASVAAAETRPAAP